MSETEYVVDIKNLSPEQRVAYRKFVQGQNLFITGPGGTGKTFLIKTLLEHVKSINANFAVCAMTGCAALLLNCNARTLHSWSGIKLAKGSKESIIASVLNNKFAVKLWKQTKGLILDEVSMLSKKIFDIIEEIARTVRKSSLPFGGMQVVFTGDFYQLPPVGTHGEPDTEQFCFESPSWHRVFKDENHIELKTIFRQKDNTYIDILLQIREGNLDEEKVDVLKQYVKREYDETLLNGCVPTKLFPIRSKADYFNTMLFSKIQEKEFVFEMTTRTDLRTYLDSNKAIPTDILKKCFGISERESNFEIDQMKTNTPCSQILRLKKGAAVMCTVNLDMDRSICNGSQGVVMDILEINSIMTVIVRFSNGVIKNIVPYFWQSEDYPTIAIGQYPLSLAWALTIHKIQGATLDMAEIDIGGSIFEYGQSYVALSRLRSLDGLYLSAFNPAKISANPKVIEFYSRLKAISENIVETESPPIVKLEDKKDIKTIRLI